MKDSSKDSKQVENADQATATKKSSGKKQGGLEKWLQPKDASPALRRTTRKRTAPKVFGDLVPSKEIPKAKKAGPKAKLASTAASKSPKGKKTKKEASSNKTAKPSTKDKVEKEREKEEDKAGEAKPKRGRKPRTKKVRADLSDAEQGLVQSNITALFAKKNAKAKVPESVSDNPPSTLEDQSSVPPAPAGNQTPAALPKALENPDPTADVDKLLQQIAEYNEDVKTEPVDEEEVIREEIAENNRRIEELNMGLKNAFELFCKTEDQKRETRRRAVKSETVAKQEKKSVVKRGPGRRGAKGAGKRNIVKRVTKDKGKAAALAKAEIQPFVSKLFEILNDDQFSSIAWNSNGDHFIIEREAFDHQFLKLSKEEKAPIQTKEFPSFIRQLNLYGFRKRREETGSDPNHYSHYVHKDGFFQKDRPDLLIHILRSGSSREKEKQGEVTEAREQLMQEKGAQGQVHYMEQEPAGVPLCQEYVLPPQDMSQTRMPPVSHNQETPTEAETAVASQNNGYYQKPNGQWAQHPSWLLNNLPQYGDPMMAQGEWINSEPGINGQDGSAQGPIQYNLADFTGQMGGPLSVELPLGLRTPISQAMDFSTYGDMPPMTESNQQPLEDQVLSNIANQDTDRDALTMNITNWLRTLPDKGQGTSSEEFFAGLSKATPSTNGSASATPQTDRPKTPEDSPFDF